jgi:hypothetical protein
MHIEYNIMLFDNRIRHLGDEIQMLQRQFSAALKTIII